MKPCPPTSTIQSLAKKASADIAAVIDELLKNGSRPGLMQKIDVFFYIDSNRQAEALLARTKGRERRNLAIV